MSVVPEGRRLFNDLSVEDNLTVGGYSQSRAQARKLRERVYSLFPRLAERRSQTAGLMSGGEQQMLAIGRALMTSPKVLLVDELSLGLMPKMIDLCLETISRLKSEGLAIVLVEQNTDRALDIADQVVVLSSGRVVGAGTPAEIRGRKISLEPISGSTPPKQAAVQSPGRSRRPPWTMKKNGNDQAGWRESGPCDGQVRRACIRSSRMLQR
ncbi:ABC transporter ATP-binding protein [Rhizobium sp. AN6A]|uniref:ABC transporter ATP-binding protein n=1 Tax=Rhizobium sp. AN6A TaxID=1841611 RepID=UPI000BC475C8|nr:ATP-binding cassette domain-containing protein [Rhizobium sp. AN6A]SOD50638.1 ABC transporter [Rhizobium sp. AN6A]